MQASRLRDLYRIPEALVQALALPVPLRGLCRIWVAFPLELIRHRGRVAGFLGLTASLPARSAFWVHSWIQVSKSLSRNRMPEV